MKKEEELKITVKGFLKFCEYIDIEPNNKNIQNIKREVDKNEKS